MDRSRGTPPRRRLDELIAAARAPVVSPPEVVGGWVPSPSPSLPAEEAEEAEGDAGGAERVWARRAQPEQEPDVPPRRARRRVPPLAAAAALVLAVAVGLVVWLRSAGGGHVLDVPARPTRVVAGSSASALPSSVIASSAPSALSAPDPSAVASAAASPAALLVVDVEGRVRVPGLVRLPVGSRVADAVRSAGGAAPGAVLARLNLARVLADGEQLLVPGPGDSVAPPAPSAAAGGSGSGPAGPARPVDLNAASQESLDALPGVGPVLAGRIIAWRTAHGRFTTVDELGEVAGIGPKALERLRPLVRV